MAAMMLPLVLCHSKVQVLVSRKHQASRRMCSCSRFSGPRSLEPAKPLLYKLHGLGYLTMESETKQQLEVAADENEDPEWVPFSSTFSIKDGHAILAYLNLPPKTCIGPWSDEFEAADELAKRLFGMENCNNLFVIWCSSPGAKQPLVLLGLHNALDLTPLVKGDEGLGVEPSVVHGLGAEPSVVYGLGTEPSVVYDLGAEPSVVYSTYMIKGTGIHMVLHPDVSVSKLCESDDEGLQAIGGILSVEGKRLEEPSWWWLQAELGPENMKLNYLLPQCVRWPVEGKIHNCRVWFPLSIGPNLLSVPFILDTGLPFDGSISHQVAKALNMFQTCKFNASVHGVVSTLHAYSHGFSSHVNMLGIGYLQHVKARLIFDFLSMEAKLCCGNHDGDELAARGSPAMLLRLQEGRLLADLTVEGRRRARKTTRTFILDTGCDAFCLLKIDVALELGIEDHDVDFGLFSDCFQAYVGGDLLDTDIPVLIYPEGSHLHENIIGLRFLKEMKACVVLDFAMGNFIVYSQE